MKENLHYYSKTQGDLESNPQEYIFNFKNNTFKFHTDSGVFSKDYIDYGTFAMLKAFIPNDIDLPILDMGAGYGPIGIVVSKLYNKKTVMCEINERAYNLILKNISENNANSIAYHSDLFEKLDNDMKFSSIITNPPIRAGKDIVFKIYEGSYERLAKNGELWVVIQKKQGAPSSKEKLTSLFGNCEIITRDKGYYILKSVKTND
ncbi:MAG: class I SAM-dependent methyltransferase [Acholeplasmatales bacterium]|nr:class I SAM-dependent methyltransferase [Acholeplasmatales bacterium]